MEVLLTSMSKYNIAHICIKKSSNVKANKTPRSRHAGNPAKRNMGHPMHSKMYVMDSDPIESYIVYPYLQNAPIG
jgi:hypothetical protein